MLEIHSLTKSFGKLAVLKGITTTIRKGEILSVIGPSGAGKTTFLRCLNLLERPDGGEIILDGVRMLDSHADVPALRRKMGMVFQQFNLFPHLTALENIAVSPRILLRQSREEAEEHARELLKRLGMEGKEDALPGELSGGQQQRVAIARAIAMKPQVLLLDEPTSALDPAVMDDVRETFLELVRKGTTLVFVTHELPLARRISSRVLYLDEGVIYEEGAPEELFISPRRPKTAAFLAASAEAGCNKSL